MWTVCITSIRHVLKLNGYGGPQAKVNGKSQRFKGWETLGSNDILNRSTCFPQYFVTSMVICMVVCLNLFHEKNP